MYLWLFLATLLHAQTAHPHSLQIFLHSATSKTVQHPTKTQLYNHYYELFPDQPTAVVFLPGMGEPSLKYYEIFYLLDLPKTTFYDWDHVGQGFSSHLLPEQKIKIHIDSFETHLSPLRQFLDELRKKHSKIILVAHSMGAHLALRLALENPKLVDAMVLTSPLIKINTRWLPSAIVEWILGFYESESYPPFYSFFAGKGTRNTFVTNSLKRQDEYQKTLDQFPQIKRQGATVGWLKAAFQSIHELQKQETQHFSVPLLILQAETDYLVDNNEQISFCSKLKNCTIEVIKNSKHEILFETDEVRALTIEKIRQFILAKIETYREVNP